MNPVSRAKILDGRLVSQHIQKRIIEEMRSLSLERRPGIAFVLVGDNPASQSYIRAKKKNDVKKSDFSL